ncbi:uncharacterized protein LOC129741566 [Uranotaenia lowii]|uniref:uncharacterized protein LOC129741566 n=1 Tax=Uranotaenia lowii TaxID=190385 RepID=UPI00247892B6|nr:uncharacterized protein LOC129741566 [Uranotaenia lowii]
MKKYYLVRQKLEVLLDAADSDGEKEDTKESEAAKKRRLQRQAEEREAKFDEETLEMEGQYCALKAALLALRPKKNESLSSSGSGEGTETMSRVKLPDIKLPGFDGKLRDWIPFRDMFFSLIHNNERLSDIDKFTYLRSAISGEALQEISSIELSSDNYQVACNMLEKRYENKKLIVKAYLDALFGIEPLKKESGEALNRLVSDFDRNIQMLGKIGEDTEKWSTMLAYMVCARLDSVTLRQWESHHNSKDVPTYQKVMDFLRDQALVLQSITPNRTEDIESRRYRTTVHTTSRIQNNCVFCGNSYHPASTCSKFRAMSVPQRFGVVKMKRLCINCLGSGHFIDRCSRGPCRECNRKHHSMLHNSFSSQSSVSQNQSTVNSQSYRNINRPGPSGEGQEQELIRQDQQSQASYTNPQAQENSTNSYPIIQTRIRHTLPQHTTDNSFTFNAAPRPKSAKFRSPRVLMSTAVVRVEDRFGNHSFARTLLDSCSEYCYVTKSFAKRLNLRRSRNVLRVQGIGNESAKSIESVEARVRPRVSEISSFSEDISFHVLPKITSNLPTTKVSLNGIKIPHDLVLADPEFWNPGPIDMIIGAEYFCNLLRSGKCKFLDDGPTLQETEFGWVVSGRVPVSSVETVA